MLLTVLWLFLFPFFLFMFSFFLWKPLLIRSNIKRCYPVCFESLGPCLIDGPSVYNSLCWRNHYFSPPSLLQPHSLFNHSNNWSHWNLKHLCHIFYMLWKDVLEAGAADATWQWGFGSALAFIFIEKFLLSFRIKKQTSKTLIALGARINYLQSNHMFLWTKLSLTPHMPH